MVLPGGAGRKSYSGAILAVMGGVLGVKPPHACPECGGVWWENAGFVKPARNPEDQQLGLGAFQIDSDGNPLMRSGVWMCIRCGFRGADTAAEGESVPGRLRPASLERARRPRLTVLRGGE